MRCIVICLTALGLMWTLVGATPVRPKPGTLVVLVRHAEKAATEEADPPLTSAGEARALALSRSLRDAYIGSIVVSEYKRTRQTAQPVSMDWLCKPIPFRVGDDVDAHAEAVASYIRNLPMGSVVLIVGHTNTIPAIIAELEGPEIPELDESDYSSMFILATPPNGRPRLIRSSYGAPSGRGE